MITIEKLSDGIGEYIKHEVIPKIGDATTKVALGIVSERLKRNPEIIESLMGNQIVSAMVGEDIDAFVNDVCDSVNRYGRIQITIPSIPLILPAEQKMFFGPEDMQRMREYIIN